jgi:curved DNA-binding protein CbpA
MAQRQKQKLYRETDYYKTLGLSSNKASQQEIKDGFRQLAKRYHPDKAKGDREAATRKFQEVSAAYEVLSNTTLRLEYDAVWQQCHARAYGKSTPANSLDPRWVRRCDKENVVTFTILLFFFLTFI